MFKLSKFLSAVGVSTAMVVTVGCHRRGAEGGFFGFERTGGECPPVECLERGQSRFTSRFINAIGVNPANNTVIGSLDLLINGITVRTSAFLSATELTPYVANIPLGNSLVTYNLAGTTAQVFKSSAAVRFFEGIASIFAYNKAGISSLLVLSDDQSVSAATRGPAPAAFAGLRVVVLSNNVITAAGSGVDVYAQLCTGPAPGVKVVSGTGLTTSNANPNWTQFDDTSDTGNLIPRVFLTGVNAIPAGTTGLSNYIQTFAAGLYNINTYATGTTARNLTPSIKYNLTGGCIYTIVITDPAVVTSSSSTTPLTVISQLYVDKNWCIGLPDKVEGGQSTITSTIPASAITTIPTDS